MRLHEQSVEDKQFARRLLIMIEADLIGYAHFALWTDEIILALDEPPYWILKLSTATDKDEQVTTIADFVYSEPFEQYENYVDDHIACLFLRYQRSEIDVLPK